jgi:hypothetical protein
VPLGSFLTRFDYNFSGCTHWVYYSGCCIDSNGSLRYAFSNLDPLLDIVIYLADFLSAPLLNPKKSLPSLSWSFKFFAVRSGA